MKQTVLCLLVCVAWSCSSNAQPSVGFGIKGGVNLTFFQLAESNFGSTTEIEVGYYGGVFTDFYMDNSFSIQPEVLLINLGDFNFLNVPIYAKYKVANNMYILAGPSMNYFFDFFSNKFKVRADISASYTISKQLDTHIKYTLGFEEFSPNGFFFILNSV
ncbi:outer membrane beta-barrel protein [Psychroserpens mesophilus]|uniref:outer membrane beta-barrel protein n=1 Tax=Psychroserpens mesophilus TaxID=325473 RepID=UPI003D64EE74